MDGVSDGRVAANLCRDLPGRPLLLPTGGVAASPGAAAAKSIPAGVAEHRTDSEPGVQFALGGRFARRVIGAKISGVGLRSAGRDCLGSRIAQWNSGAFLVEPGYASATGRTAH